jgi:hypothetical protein
MPEQDKKNLRSVVVSLRDEMDQYLRDLRSKEIRASAGLEDLRNRIKDAEKDLAQYDRVKNKFLAALDADDAG